MNAMPLLADRGQIGTFLGALFRYADPGTFVSLRAFDQFERGKPPILIDPILVDDNHALIARAGRAADHVANIAAPAVFAPPVATFSNASHARTVDLANGVALSVEIDAGDAHAKLRQLEHLLGPVTVAITSGSDWVNPDTGEVHPKMHLHWRLSEPTRTPEDHQRLQDARWLAAVLVEADRSAAPSAHPLRWPGSWNRKGTAKLAGIVMHNDAAELHLGDAFEALQTAVEASGLGKADDGPRVSGEPQAPLPLIASAFAALPNADVPWDEWTRMGMAVWRATGASEEGLAIWAEWSAKSGKHTEEACADRWRHYSTSPPQRIGAGTIFHMARLAGWVRPTRAASAPPQNDETDAGYWRSVASDPAAATGRRQHGAGEPEPWPDPVDFLAAGDLVAAPLLQADHVPDALHLFAADTAKRMGVDPTSVALSALVCCASCISEEWAVQPKRRDYTWTENARLWGAIVGEPSILKSPVIAACTRPIDKLDAEARARHVEAMKLYRVALQAARADKSGMTPEPPYPRLDRYLVEGATVEALSEVLRDDEEAKQRGPQGKVLSRHDEMSEFFGGLDRYKSGAKGGSDRGAYLRLYNGGRYTVDRIGRGTFAVPSWSACFVGGIQPGPIQRIARDAADDGLRQRFVYVVPDRQGRGEDAAPDAAAGQRYAALFPALVALHPGRPIGGGPIPSVVLDEGAHQHRDHVDAMARALAGMPDTSPRLKTALEKWPGLFARLALTFHLVDVADARAQHRPQPVLQVIPATTAAKVAAFMLEVLLPHLQRADALMFLSEQSGHASWVAGYILAHGLTKITTRDVTRAYGALRPPEMKRELASVMESLVTVGWLEPEQSSNPAKKDASTWQVNPAVHTRYAERSERERERRRQARESIAAAVALRRAAQEARGAA